MNKILGELTKINNMKNKQTTFLERLIEEEKAFKEFLNTSNKRGILYGLSNTEIKENTETMKPKITEKRADGNTTRLVDYYIQELFNNFGNFVIIKDHHDDQRSHKNLLNKVLKRLELEHKNIIVYVNRIKNSITLLKSYEKQ